MKKFIDFFVTQKFRFDLAISFLVFVNFGLLSITASTQVQLLLNRWGIEFDIYSIIIYIIGFAFICTWAFGYFLDRYIRYYDGMMNVQNTRNPQITEIVQNTRELKEQVSRLEKEVERIKNEKER